MRKRKETVGITAIMKEKWIAAGKPEEPYGTEGKPLGIHLEPCDNLSQQPGGKCSCGVSARAHRRRTKEAEDLHRSECHKVMK